MCCKLCLPVKAGADGQGSHVDFVSMGAQAESIPRESLLCYEPLVKSLVV